VGTGDSAASTSEVTKEEKLEGQIMRGQQPLEQWVFALPLLLLVVGLVALLGHEPSDRSVLCKTAPGRCPVVPQGRD